MRRLVLALASLALLAACGSAPKLDGSSEQAYAASLERVRQSLDEKRRLDLDSALMAMSLVELGDQIAVAQAGGDPKLQDEQEAGLRAAVDGLTADQVIEKTAPAREKLMNMKP